MDEPPDLTTEWDAGAPAPATTGIRQLVVSRVFEQGVLGLSTIWLARRLGVIAFAPVAILFVVNSMAVTVSDFGVGLAVLRLPVGRRLNRWSFRRVRLVNGLLAALGLLSGLLLGGTTGAVVGWSGVIWALSAEAYVRKSAIIREGLAGRAAMAEGVGSVLFAAAVAGAGRSGATAIVLVGAGFAAKHATEALWARGWSRAFSGDGDRGELDLLWFAQLASYGTANVDYLTVGILLAKPTFSVYVLSFRLANALPAQIANVTSRVSLVDFGSAVSVTKRQATYDRYVPRLLAAGGAGAAITIAIAPVLPHALGPEWKASTWVLIVLALGVPWRMVLGVASSLVLAAGLTRTSLRWELTRLVLFGGAFIASASIGFGFFTATVTLSIVVATVVYHRKGTALTGIVAARVLWPAAAVTVALAGLAGARIPG